MNCEMHAAGGINYYRIFIIKKYLKLIRFLWGLSLKSRIYTIHAIFIEYFNFLFAAFMREQQIADVLRS